MEKQGLCVADIDDDLQGESDGMDIYLLDD